MTATPILGLAAYSGVGKTTLLCGLLPQLKARGLRVGVLKGSHHDVEVDQPGKDSHRIRMAGASPVMLSSPYRRILITERQPQRVLALAEELAAFPREEIDLILIEGFKDAAIPKLELHRPSLGKPLLYSHDAHIIAIASDQTLQLPAQLIRLDLNDISGIAEFMLRFVNKHRQHNR